MRPRLIMPVLAVAGGLTFGIMSGHTATGRIIAVESASTGTPVPFGYSALRVEQPNGRPVTVYVHDDAGRCHVGASYPDCAQQGNPTAAPAQ